MQQGNYITEMSHLQIKLCFPEEGLVYDYQLDDAGISILSDEEDEDKGRKVLQA